MVLRTISSWPILSIATLVVGSYSLPVEAVAADAAAPAAAAEEADADYQIMPLQPWMLGETPQEKKQQRDLDIRKEGILRGSEPFDAQATRNFLQTYYSRYYFPLLTHPKHLGDWPKARVNLARSLATPNLQEPPLLAVHDFLVDLIYQTMVPLIRGNYHPAARCNAMLLLGSLNSQDAVFVGDKRRRPIPLIQSLKVMLDELGNPNQIDGVRAAALVGILRHVEIDRQLADVPGGQRRLAGNQAENMIIDTMLNVVNAKDPPDGRSTGGHTWMRRRAVEILGYLGSPGQNNSVLTALDAVMADNNASVSLRCTATEALGRLRFPANAKLAVADLAKKAATVAVVACRKELQRVEDQEAAEAQTAPMQPGGSYGMDYGGGSMTPAPGGMPYDMPSPAYGADGGMPAYGMPDYGMPGMGPGMGPGGMAPAAKFNPLGYQILLTRRRVAHQLVLTKRGLLGPDASMKPASKAKAGPGADQPPGSGGLSALARSDAERTAVDTAVSNIDAILREVEKSTFNEMKALVTELRAKVQQLEDKCGIVVELPAQQAAGAAAQGLLANPLDVPTEIPGLDVPAVPDAAPDAKGQPAAPAPAAGPAAASPAGEPPATPAEPAPPAAAPQETAPPAAAPPAAAVPPDAVPSPANAPAAPQPPAP